MKVLGIDCEGVIFKAVGRQLPDALDSIKALVQSGNFEKVHVVSRANLLGKVLFPIRLRMLNFWEYTGIPRTQLHFCKHDKDKAGICAELGVTDFIDDRLTVLHFMENVERRYALNPHRRREFKKYPEIIEEVRITRSWRELLPIILGG